MAESATADWTSKWLSLRETAGEAPVMLSILTTPTPIVNHAIVS